nr:hypothetical protein [Tanacetum cinerariifolium]
MGCHGIAKVALTYLRWGSRGVTLVWPGVNSKRGREWGLTELYVYLLNGFGFGPRLRANEIKGGCQVGLRAKSHGVLGRVEWYCSGMVRVHRMVCEEEGFLAGRFVRITHLALGLLTLAFEIDFDQWAIKVLGLWILDKLSFNVRFILENTAF